MEWTATGFVWRQCRIIAREPIPIHWRASCRVELSWSASLTCTNDLVASVLAGRVGVGLCQAESTHVAVAPGLPRSTLCRAPARTRLRATSALVTVAAVADFARGAAAVLRCWQGKPFISWAVLSANGCQWRLAGGHHHGAAGLRAAGSPGARSHHWHCSGCTGMHVAALCGLRRRAIQYTAVEPSSLRVPCLGPWAILSPLHQSSSDSGSAAALL